MNSPRTSRRARAARAIHPHAALALALSIGLLPASVPGAVFTVGPGGSHATVQSALDTANATPGDDEVRIAAGTYPEVLAVYGIAEERLDASGGWNATFDTRVDDPALTVIDAESNGRVLHAEAFAGVIALQNLTFTRGSQTFVGGVALVSRVSGQVFLSDCVVSHSLARTTGGAGAEVGGVQLAGYATGRVGLSRCEVHSNRVEAQDAFARAGGIQAYAGGTTHLVVEANLVRDNVATGAQGSFAGGVEAFAGGSGVADVVDNMITDNTAARTPGVNLFTLPGSVDARVVFRRNHVRDNIGTDVDPTFQMDARGEGPGQILVSDSLIVDGIGAGGFTGDTYDGASVDLVNTTLAGNDGVDLRSSGGLRISNTLADDTSLFSGNDVLQNNLFGIEPGYVDRAAGDYRLLATSPAIGAGTLTPPGGLGATDIDGNARVRGIGVDLGAYEADDPRLFVDGFE